MTAALIAALVFLAVLVQTLSGFGFAIIVMPLATLALGIQTSAPLIAMTGLTVYAINVVRYRRAINLGELARLAVASALGVPIGIWLLSNVSESVVRQLLGLVLVAYALYALLRPATARLRSQRWAYPAGFIAGCLGGAYNTPGPPAIVYGSLRQWPKDEFRAVLQTLFFCNAVLVVAAHFVAGHVTTQVVTLFAWALPASLLGIMAGSRLDKVVNQARFRTLVTVMILALGLVLLSGLGR
jgi:uncharacterized membrane protein YfcA